METKTATKRPVLVTTAHRGVFFGYLTRDGGDVVTLERARNCMYWTREVGGFLGLAASGPVGLCRIGARVDRITLRDITSVTKCSPAAVEAWEGFATWK